MIGRVSCARVCRWLAFCLAFFAAAPALAAKQSWVVKGRLEVEHRLSQMRERFGNTSALEGVLVKVSARTKVLGKWATWNTWDKVRTDATGAFTISKKKNKAARQIKVEVKFDSKELEIRHATSNLGLTKVKWYTIFDNGRENGPGTLDIGRLTFGPGSGHELDDDEPHRHAELWVVAKLMMDHLAKLGPDFAFESKVRIKHPHNSSWIKDGKESSHIDPSTRVIYVYLSKDGSVDHFSTGTIWHEMSHLWAFEHAKGDMGLFYQLVKDGSVHDLTERSFVAFHEGFAEFSGGKLHEILLNRPRRLPLNRAWRNNIGLKAAESLQHRDVGWVTIFRTLNTRDLHRYDFNGTIEERVVLPTLSARRPCTSPHLTFKEILAVFTPDETAGYKRQISKDEMTLGAYLERVDAYYREITPEHVSGYRRLFNARDKIQPLELFCRPMPKGIVAPAKSAEPNRSP